MLFSEIFLKRTVFERQLLLKFSSFRTLFASFFLLIVAIFETMDEREGLNMMRNTNSHLQYINATTRYLRYQIRDKPRALMLGKDAVPIDRLSGQLTTTIRQTESLYKELWETQKILTDSSSPNDNDDWQKDLPVPNSQDKSRLIAAAYLGSKYAIGLALIATGFLTDNRFSNWSAVIGVSIIFWL